MPRFPALALELTGMSALPEVLYGRNSGHRTDDALGSVRLVVDATGGVEGAFDHDVWGVPDTSVTPPGAELRAHSFQGALGVRNEVASTGLYYARHRYYSPDLARWLSADPIGFAGGLNLYTGMGNSPTNFVDPEGLEQCPPGYRYGKGGMEQIPGYDWDADAIRAQQAPMKVAQAALAAALAYELAAGASLALPYLGYRAAAAGYARLGGALTGSGFFAGRMLSGSQSLFHGSINDTARIRQNGFQNRSCPTYVSPNIEAAQNAIGPNRTRFQPATDPGIIQMNVPNNLYRRTLQPKAEPYAGWAGTSRDMQEIPVTEPYHIHILNAGRQR